MIRFLRRAIQVAAKVVTGGRYEPRAPKDGRVTDFRVPSVLEIAPPPMRLMTEDERAQWKADYKAIASDWQVVGDDLRAAIDAETKKGDKR